MYNTELPTRAELPSARQLTRSTLLAGLVAGVLLTVAVLPAEYGIDPTGVGRLLGLQRMGEIKTAQAREAAQENAPIPGAAAAAAPAAAAVAPAITPAATPATATPVAAMKNDEVSVTLKPGQAAEIKLAMDQGAKVAYQWAVRGGAVNFDTHGDPVKPPAGFYHGYGKGRQSMGEKGELEAAFDGQHGWYWRNRSNENAVITLRTQGGYSALKRVL